VERCDSGREAAAFRDLRGVDPRERIHVLRTSYWYSYLTMPSATSSIAMVK
jgi:hypothetical protein